MTLRIPKPVIAALAGVLIVGVAIGAYAIGTSESNDDAPPVPSAPVPSAGVTTTSTASASNGPTAARPVPSGPGTRPFFDDVMRHELTTGADALPESQADCVVAKFDQVPLSRINRDTADRLAARFSRACAP